MARFGRGLYCMFGVFSETGGSMSDTVVRLFPAGYVGAGVLVGHA